MEKTCAHCGKTFEGHATAVYCSNLHRWAAYKKRKKAKSLGAAEQPPQITPPLQPRIMKELTPPLPLDVASRFVIDTQRETIIEQKDEIKKLREKLEAVTTEKNQLEKQVERGEAEVSKKPTALGSLVETAMGDPNFIPNTLNALPGVFAGLKELFKNSAAPAIQGIEGGTPAVAHVLDQWLAKQPEDVRKKFIEVVNNLMRYGHVDDLRYTLEQMNNVTLRATG